MPRKDLDVSDAEIEDAVDEWREALRRHVDDFLEEREVAAGILPELLIELAVTTRAMHYVLGVEKPSGLGLRMDLDRFRVEIDDLLRIIRKGADEFVARAKESVIESGMIRGKRQTNGD
jgi:hypothetical protein